MYAELDKINKKNECPTCETVKKKMRFMVVLLLLIMMEETLTLWVKHMKRKSDPIYNNVKAPI
jgi:hypothetical protein